jgi:Fur family ferric uptake transcriptional regulator
MNSRRLRARRTDSWSSAREELRARGMRWTPQRRLLLGVLEQQDGHVTATELIARCRAADPATTPSTVYRTLDVLEEIGLVRHAHGVNGREEYHIRPRTEHGHLYCSGCGRSWQVEADEAAALAAALNEQRGFSLDLSHLTVVGRCATCNEVGGRG